MIYAVSVVWYALIFALGMAFIKKNARPCRAVGGHFGVYRFLCTDFD